LGVAGGPGGLKAKGALVQAPPPGVAALPIRAAGAVLAAYLRLCWRTSNVIWLRPPPATWGKGPVVLAAWHGRLWTFGLARPPGGPTCCLVSGHRDGLLIGGIAAWFGVEPVFGSSRGASRSAWRALRRTLAGGGNVAIAPDGPLGPARRASPGAVRLAQSCRVPLLPCGFSTRRGIELSSWDRLLLPVPFDTIYLVVGEPLAAASATLLTLALDDLQRVADIAAGRVQAPDGA
jgi:lysophospholipid acyltransferase (LPLAT)-like uncharacterized protein